MALAQAQELDPAPLEQRVLLLPAVVQPEA